jgi:hypothetical protein
MSFALSTIILFLLFTPGIIFKINYFTTEFAKNNSNRVLLDDLIWASIPALILHAFGLSIAYEFTGYSVNYMDFGKVLIGKYSSADFDRILNNFHTNILPIIVYQIWVNLLAIFTGHLCRNFVRVLGLDVSYRLFRFTNKWLYLLKGESLQFPKKSNRLSIKYQIDSILVEALVNNNKCSILYQGILLDFYSNRYRQLETLVISDARYKKISRSDKKFDFTKIKSTQFIIPYESVQNINLLYLTLTAKGFESEIKKYRNFWRLTDEFDYLKRITIYICLIFSMSIICLTIVNNTNLFWRGVWIAAFVIVPILVSYIKRELGKKCKQIIDDVISKKGEIGMDLLYIENEMKF